MNKIRELNGKPIYLTSSNLEGWVLSIVLGDLVVSHVQKRKWRLLPVGDNEFVIVSASSPGFHVICSGEDAYDAAKLLDLNRFGIILPCRWKISSKGEFYQERPDIGKVYLWVVNKELRTTPDSYLAEIWEFFIH